MLKWLTHWLKWKLAGEELEELYRWRVHWGEYRRWLAEFEDVSDALDSLDAKVRRRERSWQPVPNGPWEVSTLREVLRKRKSEREE